MKVRDDHACLPWFVSRWILRSLFHVDGAGIAPYEKWKVKRVKEELVEVPPQPPTGTVTGGTRSHYTPTNALVKRPRSG